MIARATRVDPNAGAYKTQRALVYHPDDPLFAKFRQRIETEQGTSARKIKHKRQAELPLWLQERLSEQDREGAGGITPLESNALGLRYATLRSGPAFAEARPEREETQAELIDPPSMLVVCEKGCLGAQAGVGAARHASCRTKRAAQRRAHKALSQATRSRRLWPAAARMALIASPCAPNRRLRSTRPSLFR